MIQDRVKAGIKRVRANGQRWGWRTIEKTDPAICTQILQLRTMGSGWELLATGWIEFSNGMAVPAWSAGVIPRRVIPYLPLAAHVLAWWRRSLVP
jgi:hypothetical protein